jgi:hypothetical protein
VLHLAAAAATTGYRPTRRCIARLTPDPIYGHRWVWGQCQCGEVPVGYVREDTETCDMFNPRMGTNEIEG